MPKFLFYAGTGFCLFLALSSAAGFAAQIDGGAMTFVAVHGGGVAGGAAAAWSIIVALVAGMAVSAILVQELFISAPLRPLPPATPASLVFFAVVALLFFAIAVHCIRHRHMFLEMTNLRELLDGRAHRGIGGIAFDS